MPIAELAEGANSLDSLTFVPLIDPDACGLEPQDGGISFSAAALFAMPATISGISTQETPVTIEPTIVPGSTPVPESPEKHIGDLAPLKEEPSYYTDINSLGSGGNLVAMDNEVQITLDGKAPKNVTEGDSFTIISVDTESRMARVKDSEGNEGNMYLGDSSVDSHLVYTQKPEVETEPAPTAIPEPASEPEEVALAPAEPIEVQPEGPIDSSTDEELQAKLNQQLLVDGQQNIYKNPNDTDNPVVWLTTENGTTIQLDGREAQNINGRIWVKINVLQDGEILTYQGIKLSGDWIPLDTFSDSSINSLTVQQLQELGFNVENLDGSDTEVYQADGLRELRESNKLLIQGLFENNSPSGFGFGDAYPFDFGEERQWSLGVHGRIDEAVVSDNSIQLIMRGPAGCQISGWEIGTQERTLKVKIPLDAKVYKVVREKTGEGAEARYADKYVESVPNDGWTTSDLVGRIFYLPGPRKTEADAENPINDITRSPVKQVRVQMNDQPGNIIEIEADAFIIK